MEWKRKLSGLLAGAMLLGTLPTTALAWNAPESDSWNAAGRDGIAARFFVGSDTHIGRNNDASSKLKNALDAFNAVDPKADGVLLVGDVTNNGDESEYDSLMGIIGSSELGKANKVQLSMGNHEYNQGTMACFEEKTKEKANQVLYYGTDGTNSTNINNISSLAATVIKLSAKNYVGDYTEQYDMVKTALETSTAKNANAPIIVMGHHGIPNTAYVTNEWKGNYGEMLDLFEQYPQVIHISGHSHATLEDARSIWQDDGYTAIQDGTIGAYFENEKGKVNPDTGADATRPADSEIASQALRIDVLNDGTVKIYRMNLTTGKYMYENEPWTFTVNSSERPYTSSRSSNAPNFAEDAQVTASDPSTNEVTVQFPAASAASAANNDMVHAYKIVMTPQDGGSAVTRTVFADYYEPQQKSNWSVKVNGLSAGKTYDVSVTALTSFESESNAITGTATTAEPAPYTTPQPDILNIDYRTDSNTDTNGHTLTVMGNPQKITDETYGTVYHFDGSKDGLRYTMSAADYNKFKNGYTMETLVKMYSKGNPFSNQESAGCGFELNDDGKTLEFWNRVGGSYKKPTTDISSLKSGWIHMMATFDGTETQLYVNGELKSTVQGADSMTVPASGAQYFYVGADTNGSGAVQNPMKCDVALARLYTGAMNAEDVMKTYMAIQAGETPSQPTVTVPTADMMDVDFSDGTAADRSATKNTDKAVGSPVIQDDADLGKKVAAFNGSYDAYMYPFDNTKYSKMTNAVTIESVFRYNEVPSSGEHDIFSNQQGGGIGLGLEKGVLQFYCNINKSGGGNSYVQPSATIEAGKWYHAVGTFDGSKVRLYLNGKKVSEKDAGGSTVHWTTDVSAQNFVIGGDSDSSNKAQFFSNGSVSLARLYSTAMTTEQVKKAYAELDPVMLQFDGSLGSLALNQECTVPTATASNGSAVTVTVTDPDGAAVTLTNGKFTPNKAGKYTFTYTTADGKKTQRIIHEAIDTANLPVTLGLVAADQAAAGGRFNVSVHLNRDSKLAVGKTEFDLAYDANAVTYVGAENEKSGLTITDNGSGSLHMAYTGDVSTEAFGNYSATRLVKLTFAAKDTGENKNAVFSFANVNIDASTGKKNAASKSITIYGKSSLDLNGDGVIGVGDIALAQNDSQKKLIAAQAAIRPYKHVVMITMDGGGICFRPDQMYYATDGQTTLTNDASIMAKRTNDYAMQLFNDYCATSYSAKSETPTISAQNYTSLLHGKEYASAQKEYQIDNTKTSVYYYPDFGKDTATYPSVFKALGTAFPNRANAAFAEWTQIVNGIIEPDAAVYTHGSTHSGGDMQDVADYIRSDAFKSTAMVYMQSDEMDAAGHSKGYYTDYYYDTLKKFDGYFKSIMDALEETGTKDETLVLFTADHGGTVNISSNGTVIGGSHGGKSNQEYDVQIALGGQTIDSGKRLTGGTNHDPAVIALTALGADVPSSMDGKADLLTQASLSQTELTKKNRSIEKVTATAGTNVNAVELKLSNVQNDRTINALDTVIDLNGRNVRSVQTEGTVLRQDTRNGKLYLTISYTKTPETLVRVNLDGAAKDVQVSAYMLGASDGKEIYGDLVTTEGTLTVKDNSSSSSSGSHSGSHSSGSNNSSNGSNNASNGSNTTPSDSKPTFSDVKDSDYFAPAVRWAVEKGITSGLTETTFGKNAACTRAQIVTFLWRAAGSPKANTQRGFTDVADSAYYTDAVAWAVENGITDGTGSGRFAPDAACTRGQMAVLLYRYQHTPAVSGSNPFSDVRDSDYSANAVLWAYNTGVTAGTSASTFAPNQICTRSQMITFLYRLLNK